MLFGTVMGLTEVEPRIVVYTLAPQITGDLDVWGYGDDGTVIRDYGTELVVLFEGGEDCIYVDRDKVVFMIICGCYSWEVECVDCADG